MPTLTLADGANTRATWNDGVMPVVVAATATGPADACASIVVLLVIMLALCETLKFAPKLDVAESVALSDCGAELRMKLITEKLVLALAAMAANCVPRLADAAVISSALGFCAMFIVGVAAA